MAQRKWFDIKAKGKTAEIYIYDQIGIGWDGQGVSAVSFMDALAKAGDVDGIDLFINSPGGDVLITWNGNISTVGFTISWSGGASGGGGQIDVNLGACAPNPTPGTYSMIVQTTVAGLGGVPIPEICVDGLPGKPASQSDFCGSGDVNSALPPGVTITECSFVDPVGTISARITSPITLDYTVKYTFVLR